MTEYSFPQWEIDRLKDRKWILQYCQPHSKGAELGVFRGFFSQILISELQPTVLYLVDLWRLNGSVYDWGPRSESEYLSYGKMTPQIAITQVRGLIDQHPDVEIHVVESYCVGFLENLASRSETLDWVYLDTTHSYHDTKMELLAIDKILVEGGILFGDDWWEDETHRHHGVCKAVREWLTDHPNYEFLAEGMGQQWAMKKVTL